jgi:hypothetical protein
MKFYLFIIALSVISAIVGVVFYLRDKDSDIQSNTGTQILIASGLLFGIGLYISSLSVTTTLFGIPIGFGYNKSLRNSLIRMQK